MRKSILITAALFAGLLTASATITPYSWQRFTTLKSPGLDATGKGHDITGGFTGNGESPGGTMPVVENIAVGGPLGPEGYFSTFSIRSRANRPFDNKTAGGNGGGNQGCLFEEPVPVSAQSYAGATKTNSSAWGNLFQTNDNWVVECWALAERFGGGSGVAPIFYTGLNRNNRSHSLQQGVIIEAINGTARSDQSRNDGHSFLRCHAVCPPNQVDTNGVTQDFYIGDPVLFKTPTNTEWMHIAVVRNEAAGTVSWYTNGVLVAATNAWRVSKTNYYASVGFAGGQDEGFDHSNGGIGMDGGARPFEGYIAELRWSYFSPGQFSLTNLLTRRVSPGSASVWYGPAVVKDPENITVWTGGAAPFTLFPATDTSLTYQWQRFSGSWATISGATNQNYVLENAQLSDSGARFRCILTKPSNSLTATSGVATVTVVNNNSSIVSGYSNAVMAEASLLAYFPVDGTSSGTNLINVKDATHNGNILNTPFAFRNGNTNIAGGNQSLSLNTPNQQYSGGLFLDASSFVLKTTTFGYVEIPGDNPGFDFATASGGNGTIEAVLYMEPTTLNVLSTEQLCWLSSCTAPGATDYYELLADYNGYIYYRNQATGNSAGVLVWAVPGGLVGKRTHVAVTFQGGTNVTCYANGISLGTKKQPSFGNTPPSATQPITIGRRGGELTDTAGYSRNLWRGSVDELAIYGSTLSASKIATHSFILNNGTAATPPSVVKISPSKFLYNGFPVQTLNVQAGGSPPFGYQWRLNNVALSGQTNTVLNVTGLANITNSYTVVITNSLGSVTSAPVVLSVIAPSGYAAKVFSSSGGGPRAFWPLNETSGTDILDWAGTHDGVISGAYTLGEQGPVVGTGSIRMYGTNGAGANFSQIVVPFYGELNSYRPALDPDGTYPLTAFDGRYSYEFWYRPDSSNAICAVSSQFTAFNGSRAGAAIYLGYTGNDGENQTTFRYWTMRIGRFNNTNQGVNQNGTGGPTPPPIGQWCHVCLVVDATSGGDKCFLYMNGVIEDSDGTGYSTDPNAGFVWNANNLAPFVMGNRNRGSLPTLPMFGALSQVAVYDYPLTYKDVTNHLSQIWAPAAFTQVPSGGTYPESISGSITLTAKAIGVPNTYVWVKDGVELAPTNNFDGTPHYPVVSTVAGDQQGPFSQRLVINQLRPSDSGQYWLRVYNQMNTNNVPPGQTNSAQATVVITPDTSTPTVVDVGPRGTTVSGPVLDNIFFYPNPTPARLFLVEAKFSKRMDPATATNRLNYSISGGVSITNVIIASDPADTKFGGDWKTVGLVTSGLTPGASYTVTVSNVRDQTQTANLAPPATFTFTAPNLRANTALWSYYYRVLGGFDSLFSGTNMSFPYVPQATAALTNFSSDAIAYNQNLGNNPSFSGQSDNYASTISAWVTPTNTGYYEFFITSDDKAKLYFNPLGADPAGAVYFGESYSGSTVFTDYDAIPYHYRLTIGQPYFLQAVHTEAGGNDMVRVGWRYLGTNDVTWTDPSLGPDTVTNGGWLIQVTNLPPIEGRFLTAYAAGPSILTQPSSIVAAAGTTTNLAVTAGTQSGMAVYQWQINNGNTGANTNKLFFAPLAFGNYSTNYRVIVTDSTFGSVTSSVVSVTPPGGVTITANPTNKAVPRSLASAVGAVATTTSGRINYTWKLDGTNVSGANYGNATQQVTSGGGNLTIASMQPTNAGPYTVAIDDGWFAVTNTTTAGTLTLANNPMITNSQAGAILSLTFPTEVGPQYVFEWKGALTNGAWNVLSTNVGSGNPATVSVGKTNAQQFMRIRMQ